MRIPFKIDNAAPREVLDYDAIESLDEFRAIVKDKKMILAFDKHSDGQQIVYGGVMLMAQMLRAATEKDLPPLEIDPDKDMIGFAVDFHSDQSKDLIAAVKVVFGDDAEGMGRN